MEEYSMNLWPEPTYDATIDDDDDTYDIQLQRSDGWGDDYDPQLPWNEERIFDVACMGRPRHLWKHYAAELWNYDIKGPYDSPYYSAYLIEVQRCEFSFERRKCHTHSPHGGIMSRATVR